MPWKRTLFNSTYEVKKLQKRAKELEMENDLLKTPGLPEAIKCVRFQFLKEYQKEYNIQKACKILQTSHSGFFDYFKRRKCSRAIENEVLIDMIEDIFHEHQGRYGARRIQKVLEQQNIHVNPKRVFKLMNEHGLITKATRRFYRDQASKTACDEKENLLHQVFKTSAKNQIWVGDIPRIPAKRGYI